MIQNTKRFTTIMSDLQRVLDPQYPRPRPRREEHCVRRHRDRLPLEEQHLPGLGSPQLHPVHDVRLHPLPPRPEGGHPDELGLDGLDGLLGGVLEAAADGDGVAGDDGGAVEVDLEAEGAVLEEEEARVPLQFLRVALLKSKWASLRLRIVLFIGIWVN